MKEKEEEREAEEEDEEASRGGIGIGFNGGASGDLKWFRLGGRSGDSGVRVAPRIDLEFEYSDLI